MYAVPEELLLEPEFQDQQEAAQEQTATTEIPQENPVESTGVWRSTRLRFKTKSYVPSMTGKKYGSANTQVEET